ncbi:hypothetical protein SCHPADRAFT_655497 [Schizopora paradoxa]|uniref:Uncharacterized protein n=1 Tax=Schizopora paradoxa TaxID=27342 RepID=A0A0H2RR37_9AGAM|nr:hypothetical protein SCHPADRAFT_655497 [Schizopora paradoxa]
MPYESAERSSKLSRQHCLGSRHKLRSTFPLHFIGRGTLQWCNHDGRKSQRGWRLLMGRLEEGETRTVIVTTTNIAGWVTTQVPHEQSEPTKGSSRPSLRYLLARRTIPMYEELHPTTEYARRLAAAWSRMRMKMKMGSWSLACHRT